ncbi:MAG: HAD family hydrolase [Thermovenabulum sp.]|uniref:HAD family hydrolase n=1 Tax=Thermovenabulum sp. TaxID=3100335 RepID=UPI003C7CF878
MNKKCVIFDVDGTLIASEHVTLESLKVTMKSLFQKDYKDEEIEFAIWLPGQYSLEKLKIEKVEETLKVWFENIKKLAHKAYLYPGIKELLEKLKVQNYKLGIISARYDYEIYEDKILREILGYFDVIVPYSSDLRPKPYTDQLEIALKKLCVLKNEALYVGDTMVDYECAKNAGVDFVLANWGERDKLKYFEDKPLKVSYKPYELLSFLAG